MDIIKLVSQFVTPGALSQIATLLGISQADMQKGLGAAVPGVLASILGTAQRPGATDALGAALTRATGEGGLATMLGRDPAAAAAAGSGVLGSLLGGGGAGKLAEALGSYTGLTKSAGGTLLGLAGSMALGALGGEAKSKGLDAKGVLGLLESNKDQITSALPSGFASALSGSGLLDGLGQQAAAATATARAAATPPKVEPARTPPPPSPPAPAPRRGMSWLWWLIGALIVLWLLWRFLAPQPEPVTEETAPPPAETTTTAPAPEPEAEPAPEPATTPAPATEPAPEEEAAAPAAPENPLVVGGVDVGAQVQSALDGLTTSLGGITDAASAEAALPQLTEARDTLSGLETTIGGLPEAGKTALGTMVASALPAIRSAADRLLADSAIAGVVKPVLDDVLGRLEALAT